MKKESSFIAQLKREMNLIDRVKDEIQLKQDFDYNATGCCALVHLRGGNNTSVGRVNRFCKRLLEQSKSDWLGTPNTGAGATSVFAIATPTEDNWRDTLTKCGFLPIHEFKRRTGYADNGNLTMYIKNII